MQQFVSVINYEKIYRHCFNSVDSVKIFFTSFGNHLLESGRSALM